MKNKLIGACMIMMSLALVACGPEKSTTSSAAAAPSASVTQLNQVEKQQKTTPIKLTIGDKVLDAYLYDSVPGNSLKEQLPMTVTLNDSDNDFCGDSIQIKYNQSDVTSGYKNGDLVFWPPASNFVIFVKDEEKSASTDNLVKLGHITSPQQELNSLRGTLKVRIELAK